MRLVNIKAGLSMILLIVYAVCATTIDTLEADPDSIESTVDQMLRHSDLGELANEMARKPSSGTTKDLLIRLSIFGRAGQRSRAHSTLLQLVEAKDFKTSAHTIYGFNVAQRAIDKDDLEGRKLFYEKIALGGDDKVRDFVELWLKTGDIGELEKWLGTRGSGNETWWSEWLRLKQQLGTVDEVYDELEQKIRENPSDYYQVEKYLRAINSQLPCSAPPCSPSYQRDISWLADVVPTDSAYGAYDLAVIVRHQNSEFAAKLLEKSLSLPFGEMDATLFATRAFRYTSIQPVVKNPEKQLRYWTKKALAEIYLETKQPLLAQPLTEELTSMDMNDIQADDVFRLAGLTQAATGHRAIESKILREEKQNEDSPFYWISRAKYYQGRNERELEWQTYRRALPRFPCKSDNPDASQKRWHLLRAMSLNVSDSYEDDINKILRDEFRLCAGDKSYLFLISRLITTDRDDLREELFVNTELLPQILAFRSNWRREEQYVIGAVMESKAWEAKRRDAVWNKLSELALKDVKHRVFSLAAAMTWNNEFKRAVPLLETCRKIAPKMYEGDLNFTLEDVERELFDAYIKVGDWRKAENMFHGGFNYWGNGLGVIAVAAAKSGNIVDAVRIWEMNANLDRRKLAGIEELAKTSAKPMLLDFYLKMKKEDPLSYVPEKALGYLN